MRRAYSEQRGDLAVGTLRKDDGERGVTLNMPSNYHCLSMADAKWLHDALGRAIKVQEESV